MGAQWGGVPRRVSRLNRLNSADSGPRAKQVGGADLSPALRPKQPRRTANKAAGSTYPAQRGLLPGNRSTEATYAAAALRERPGAGSYLLWKVWSVSSRIVIGAVGTALIGMAFSESRDPVRLRSPRRGITWDAWRRARDMKANEYNPDGGGSLGL